MNLTDILNPEQIVSKLTAPDRWAAIDQLIDLLVRTGKVRPENRETVRDAVKVRERANGTGIGYGVALPHAAVACVSNVVAVFARLSPGVDFQALDNQPVTLCLLVLAPQGQSQLQLQTLSTIARLLTDTERRQRLNAAQTANEILQIVRAAA